MQVTTSIKLPEALKASIAKVAAQEGKTLHSLRVETLQSAMEDALARLQLHADGEAAWQDTLQTNTVFKGSAFKAYVLARASGGKPARPKPVPLDAIKPLTPAHG